MTSTGALRPGVGVNSPVVVITADVVDDTVCVNPAEGAESAAADIAPLRVVAWVAVKLVTAPTVVETSAVGATVVVRFAAVVVWLGLMVSVRR